MLKKVQLKSYRIHNHDYLAVRTKTGKEIHLAGGSTTICGVWLRVSAIHRAVNADVTCEKCKLHLEKFSQEATNEH